MALISFKPITPSRGFRQDAVEKSLSKEKPLRKMRTLLKKSAGRNSSGRITVRHQGGRKKRFYRAVDFKRSKVGVPGTVASLHYDPNRSAHLALVQYKDGDKRYILAAAGMKVGDRIVAGPDSESAVGNAMPLAVIPIGTSIYNIELKPGSGAKVVRSAGTSAVILSRSEESVVVRLPSTEVRLFSPKCMATIGQVSNVEHGNEVVGKAGRSRHMGKRPQVRGVAMDPRSHPHGGGEGRSGIGMKHPKSVYGRKTLGVRTRKLKKASNKFIVNRRKK